MPRLGSRVRASFSAHIKRNLARVTGELLSTSPGGGMVDALVSGASVERRAGSSPVLGTSGSRISNILGGMAELVDALL